MQKRNDLLLVIDMQNVYLPEEEWACPNVREAMKNIKNLLDREAVEQVIFTKFVKPESPSGTWNDYNTEYEAINNNPYLNDMMKGMQPYLEQWPVYEKSIYSSMRIPEVLEAARKADHVLIAGVVAECCVMATMIDAIDEGHKVIYLTDCAAGMSEENEAAVKHLAECFSPMHTMVMDSHTYLGN